MLAHEQFLEHVHGALRQLYEPDRLRHSPLATLFGVADRHDTFLAVQRILIGTIEALEPQADGASQPGAWEIYELLFYRYVQQLTQRQVAKQLAMSVRHLRRREHAAVEVLACQLWERFDLDGRIQDGIDEELAPAPVAEGSPSVSEELAWLKNVPPQNPIDLGQVLLDVARLAKPLAVQHGVRVHVSTPAVLPSLAVPAVALSQTLLGLLSVAIHRASGGEVSLLARSSQSVVEVKVRGVAHVPVAHPFSEDDRASLDLTKRLAEVCDARLAISDDERAFDAIVALSVIEQLPVLVIDDNADTLQLLRRYVVSTRYRLVATQDPGQAMSLVERFAPKVIVLDVMMPEIDGWNLLVQLRQKSAAGRTPIIVCTVLPQEDMAFALGATGFVRKPVTRRAFLAALDQQVEAIGTPTERLKTTESR